MKLTQPLVKGRNVCEACGIDEVVKKTGDQLMCLEGCDPCPIRPQPEVVDPVSVRGATHGDFARSSVVVQLLRSTWRAAPKWGEMTPAQQQAFDEIALKQVRILYGDPKFRDHWIDIQGYSELGGRDCDV